MPEANEYAAKARTPHTGAVHMSPGVAAAVSNAANTSKMPGLSPIGGHRISTASAGGDVLEVNTEELRRVAESGRAALAELSEIIQTVRELVAATEGYWTGDAAEFFREWCPQGLADYERCVKDLSEYPRELISYADEYEGVITKAEVIAQSVEGVEWTAAE